ncbi:c-type cytochrome [Flavihumibacter solisilvae]|uniref:c-type cytochrome n=1 Tax=Flavihumibacter solisilvae TaxID=1349421 RepID=UPI00068D3B98|nr:cytochrome c [Flavihumibacter solisilvae]
MLKTVTTLSFTFAVLLTCCSIPEKTKSPLNADNIKSELFTIDLTKDTTLITSKGAKIHIPMGAIEAAGTVSVQLEIKEAYSITDMINGGLTTSSSGQPLVSGGMIYIDAIGDTNVKITSSITISLPTGSLNKDMQLFKGKLMDKGTINWTNPAPLFDITKSEANDAGGAIFQDNCASCHAIGKPLTGPDLAHVSKRRSKEWLYAFTRNNQQVIASGDFYANCLYNYWNKAAMNNFPSLTDVKLRALYAYIENESNSKNLPVPLEAGCLDSCVTYFKEQFELASTTRQNPRNPLFYEFNIISFGWYNIDLLLEGVFGAQVSELTVRLKSEHKKDIQVYLIIPSQKVFLEGRLLSQSNDQFVFQTKDGKIELPQNVLAYIIALSENNEGILFGKKEFLITTRQHIDLNLRLVSKEQFQEELTSMSLDDLKTETLKPRNCNCDCFPMQPKRTND